MAKKPSPRLTTSPTQQAQLSWNEAAYASRHVKVGGVYTILGPAGTAVKVGLYATLRIVNTAGAAAYVAIGAAAVAAPTGLTDGHYIPPNGELLICTGDQGDYVRGSAATVGVYKLVESVVLQEEDRQTQV